MPTALRSTSLSQVRGLTAAEVSKLKKAGIDTTRELLAAAPSTYAEQKLAKATGLTLARMREAVNRADLMQVSGMGPARADLFENVGVNSAKELAQRNPAALAKVLEKYVHAHPELNYRLPSPTTVASLVAKAKGLDAPPPAAITTKDEAIRAAESAMNQYIDDVLFNVKNPEGESFRYACLEGRPAAEWEQMKAQMHAEVRPFLTEPMDLYSQSGFEAQEESSTGFLFYGRFFGLYTEVSVAKATGTADRVYVEID